MRDARPWVEHESSRWLAEGLLTAEQRAAILERYPVVEKRKRQAALFALLGAVLVGVGAILFVASNWDQIPRFVRVVMLVASLLAAHAGGWWLRERTGRMPHVGHGLHVLGSLLFGASLFLVAQIYNVEANAPFLLLLWFVGVAPMAWGLSSRPTLALAILLWGLWIVFQGVAWIGRDGSIDTPLAILFPFLAYGTLLWGLGRLHASLPLLAPFAGFDAVLRLFGLVAIAGSLYGLTFDLPFTETRPERAVVPQLLALALLDVGLGLSGVFVWALRGRGTRTRMAEAVGLAALALYALAAYLSLDPLANTIVFNLVFFALILGIVALGVQSREEALVNAGVALFLLDVVTRYFDFFYDLLDRSLFFIAGGLVLIAGAWLLERQRKHLVARAREVRT